MNATEAIIAIDGHRLDNFALAVRGESWASLHRALDTAPLGHANELIEGEILLPDRLLIVLGDACGVYPLLLHAEA